VPKWHDELRIRRLKTRVKRREMLEPVLGRDSELRAIDSFFRRLGEGPALLAFEGDPGIGKTTLLRATVKRAREDGVRVLAAAGAVAESRLSYVALTDLLSEVGPERFAALPEPQLEALDAALLRAHPPEAGAGRPWPPPCARCSAGCSPRGRSCS
jgi:MoxR-like ATPase